MSTLVHETSDFAASLEQAAPETMGAMASGRSDRGVRDRRVDDSTARHQGLVIDKAELKSLKIEELTVTRLRAANVNHRDAVAALRREREWPDAPFGACSKGGHMPADRCP
jgi:hypothetical protein